jgi:hypothetical protein
MNKKLFLIYLLFFISVNAMAAFESVDCTSRNDFPSNKFPENQNCDRLKETRNNISERPVQHSGDVANDGLVTVSLNRESKGGALIFILLIPALLVFIFSRFKKSNK